MSRNRYSMISVLLYLKGIATGAWKDVLGPNRMKTPRVWFQGARVSETFIAAMRRGLIKPIARKHLREEQKWRITLKGRRMLEAWEEAQKGDRE